MKAIANAAAAVIFAGILPAPAQADDDTTIATYYSLAYQSCLQDAKAVRAIQECNAREIQYQQNELHHDLQALLAARPDDQVSLEDDQNRWADAAYPPCVVFSRRQGSLNSMKAQDCFRDEIIKRRMALEAQLQGKSP